MCASSQSLDLSSVLSNPSRIPALAQSLQATPYKSFLLQGMDKEAGWLPHPDPFPLVGPRYLAP